jgi:predicted metalloprotease with PDZ domain
VTGSDARDPDEARRTGQTLRRFDFGGQFQTRDGRLTVGTVQEDGFFHNAGIREGDQIISINGQTVSSEDEFRRFAAGGQGRVPVVVTRGGERQEIMVNLDDLNREQTGQNGNRAALGIWFQSHPEGAFVMHVVPGSPAERAGIRRGDWLMSVNGTACDDWQRVQEQLGQAELNSTANLQIARDGQPMRLEAGLGSYQEVFADSPEWSEIAAQYQNQDYGQGRQFDNAGRYWTGEGMRSGAGNMQHLERRILQLEREVGNLREQLKRGDSTRTPDTSAADNRGRETGAPDAKPNDQNRNHQNNGQRTSAPSTDQ